MELSEWNLTVDGAIGLSYAALKVRIMISFVLNLSHRKLERPICEGIWILRPKPNHGAE